MVIKKFVQNSLRVLGLFLLPLLLTLLCKTLKVRKVNHEKVEQLEKDGQNYLLAFWHGTMLYPWFLVRNKGFMGIVSQSKDGGLLTAVLDKWNILAVRGSSSKGGKEALDTMVEYLHNKGNVCITPDGPTGPRLKAKAGTVVTSKKSGAPIVLLGVGYENRRALKNWDRFEIPKFFSSVNLVFSDPIYIDEKLTYDETSVEIEKVETELNRLQDAARNF